MRRAMTPVCLFAFLVTSCGAPFDPYWRVEKFRVLAIKSDPITLDVGEVAALEALVYDAAGATPSYQWEWCPFRTSPQNEYACPFTRAELAELLVASAAGGEMDSDMMAPPGFELTPELLEMFLPDFELGTEPVARFPYPLTPELVRGLCDTTQAFTAGIEDEELAGQIGVSDCERGYEVTVRVIVSVGDEAGERIVAGKRLTLSTGSPDFDNANPDVTDIQIRLDDSADFERVRDELPWASADNAWHTLDPMADTPILTNINYDLRMKVDLESLDVFRAPAPLGADRDFNDPEREAAVMRWFATEGDIDSSGRLFKEGVFADPDDADTPTQDLLDEASATDFVVTYYEDPPPGVLVFPDQDIDWDRDGIDNSEDPCPSIGNPIESRQGECTVRLWAVVRDGRLGIDWVERRLVLVGDAQPPN
ncbi:MAG: hypothetical protein AAGI01_05880 [Myxococcota bacterium]